MPTAATATKPKPATRRTTKPAAKKPTAKKPAMKASAAPKDLVDMTVDKLIASPFNPRKTFDQAGIDELAASLKVDGRVFQNLVARKWTGKGKATHEIIAGERRFRAVSQLIKAGDWPADRPVPVLVIEADDIKVIELATVENVQRRDLTPLEEARAFAQLRDLERTTDEIAVAVSMSLRHVQLRLQLIDTLTPAGQEAMDRSDISLAQARMLMLEKDPELQDAVLSLVLSEAERGNELMPDDIRHHILADCAPVAKAIFPLEQYTGDYIVDDGDEEIRYFKDKAQFGTLQEAAIEALEKKLKAEWSWVELVRGYFYSHEYETGPKPADKTVAGVIIQVHYDKSVDIMENRVKRVYKAAKKAAPTPQPPFTKHQLAYAHFRKTRALQAAVSGDPRTAKILACLALMGADSVAKIGRDHVSVGDAPSSPELVALEGEVKNVLPSKLLNTGDSDFDGLLLKSASEWRHIVEAETELEAYAVLKALDDDNLDKLFTVLVASQVSAFSGFSESLGDSPLACVLADDLKIDMSKRWFIDDEYLALLRKPRLKEIIDTGWPADDDAMTKEREKMTAKALRTAITLRAHMVLPREMKFGSQSDLENGKAINFGPGARLNAQAAE